MGGRASKLCALLYYITGWKMWLYSQVNISGQWKIVSAVMAWHFFVLRFKGHLAWMISLPVNNLLVNFGLPTFCTLSRSYVFADHRQWDASDVHSGPYSHWIEFTVGQRLMVKQSRHVTRPCEVGELVLHLQYVWKPCPSARNRTSMYGQRRIHLDCLSRVGSTSGAPHVEID